MSQLHNVSPNITDPDLLPRKQVVTRPIPLKQDTAPAMREPSTVMIQDNSFNRNLVIILVVLAVILILFLAYMYFYKGSDPAPARPAIYGSPPGTTYPMGMQAPVQMQEPPSCGRQQSCPIPSRGSQPRKSEERPQPPKENVASHDKLKQEINSEDLRKELEDMNNRKNHDNYPSEHNKPQPSGVRFGYADEEDEVDEPREYKGSSNDNFDDVDDEKPAVTMTDTPVDDNKSENVEHDIHEELSRFICGEKLKSCGFCKRKVTPGTKCSQHNK